uniref:Branched-chain-amino-acid aminotransferase n=1 Tax=Corethrella appendiculata TaxID=1370023 RepID=U5EJ01_9DIPT
MVIRSKELCRRVLENQHKLIQFLQMRLCSNQKIQELAKYEEDDFPRTISSSIKYAVQPQPNQIQHQQDVGQQFKYSDISVRLAGPHQLQPKPDVDDLAFGKYFTDHMLKIQYHRRLGGWLKPEITPFENLVLHPAAKVFHYAVELFEGIKAYRGVDGRIRVFRPEMNMARMNLTAYRSGLPTFDAEEMVKSMARLISIDSEWVPHTESASLYIRPTLIGIEPTLGVASSESALMYTILSPVGPYFKPGHKGGLTLYADPKYVRAWPGGCGDRKMGSNYAPTIHVQKEAQAHGCHQVLWLYGEDHQLTEVGVMNIFMVYVNEDGVKELITPPLNGLILPGITRDSIIQLAKELGDVRVREDVITMPMVKKLLQKGRLLELFGSGTAAVISPIERIHYLGEQLHIPTLEQEDSLSKYLLKTLTDIQYGKLDHPWAYVID